MSLQIKIDIFIYSSQKKNHEKRAKNKKKITLNLTKLFSVAFFASEYIIDNYVCHNKLCHKLRYFFSSKPR